VGGSPLTLGAPEGEFADQRDRGVQGFGVIPRKVVARARTPDDGEMKLIQDGTGYSILTDDQVLMPSRTHGSEEAMAKLACLHIARVERPRVLVGGLGMGYTLRAALDHLPAEAEVICAELMEAIVTWHEGPLGPLADHPIRDPRVQLRLGDVADLVRASEKGFDVILLDVDNGPIPLTAVGNWWLYAPPGLSALRAAVRPGGILVVWSAGEDDEFLDRMKHAGFRSEAVRVAARTGRRRRRGRRGNRHVLFVGRR